MSQRRTCGQCGKPFEQTFGGRPRKNCYECVPARLNQGQSTGVKPTTVARDEFVQTLQAEFGTSQHCGWCGSYNRGAYCNPNHKAKAVARRQAGYSPRKPRRGIRFNVMRTRPIELARKRREMQEAVERSERQAHAARQAA